MTVNLGDAQAMGSVGSALMALYMKQGPVVPGHKQCESIHALPVEA